MISLESKEVRDRATRWIEEGHSQLGVILGVLNDYDRLHGVADAAEQESERLRGLVKENEQLRDRVETAEHECGRLGEEVSQLRAEIERTRKERVEVAEWLSGTMNEVLLKLRPQQA